MIQYKTPTNKIGDVFLISNDLIETALSVFNASNTSVLDH